MVMNLLSTWFCLDGCFHEAGVFGVRRAVQIRWKEEEEKQDLLSGSNPPKPISNHQPKTKEVSFV